MRTRGESPARGGSLRGRVAALLATTATLAAFAGCADDALDRAYAIALAHAARGRGRGAASAVEPAGRGRR